MTETLYVGAATDYDHVFARVTQAFVPVLLDAAQSPLDVATGAGAAARDQAGPGGEIVAGDISATMLDVARQNLENAGIRFGRFDRHKMPYPDDRTTLRRLLTARLGEFLQPAVPWFGSLVA